MELAGDFADQGYNRVEMFRTDSAISRSLMLLAAIGLCVSPLFAFGAQGDVQGDMLCLITMKTMKTMGNTQLGELEKASQPAAVKSCCAKHHAQSSESGQPVQPNSDQPPCSDSGHCACCLILHTNVFITPAAPLAGTLPAPAITLARPAAEQCVVPGWHATLLRPPIG